MAEEQTVENETEETTPELEDVSGDNEEPETSEEDKTEEVEKIDPEEHRKLQARLAFAEREKRRMEREREQVVQADTVQDSGKPIVDNFESYDDFIDALTDWKLQQKDNRDKLELEKRIKAEKLMEIDRIVAEEQVKDPDFLKKAYIPKGLENLVNDSDRFVDLALYFGRNPEIAHKLVYMDPIQAARQIGKLEASFEVNSPRPRTETRAPKTTNKIRGTSSKATKREEDMTTDEWFEARKKSLI